MFFIIDQSENTAKRIMSSATLDILLREGGWQKYEQTLPIGGLEIILLKGGAEVLRQPNQSEA